MMGFIRVHFSTSVCNRKILLILRENNIYYPETVFSSCIGSSGRVSWATDSDTPVELIHFEFVC